MDVLRMCLVLSLCLTLMTHVVFSAPTYGEEVEHVDFQPGFNADLALIRNRRDNGNEEVEDFLTRIRRNVAQMASGRRGYNNGRGRYRSRGRLYGRRRYETRRKARGRGRVVVW